MDTARRRRRRRFCRGAASLACVVALARASTVARAHDDAWLDALDDDAFERDEAAGSFRAMDGVGDDVRTMGAMEDVETDALDADAFDAFGLQEEEDDGDAVMEELRTRRLNVEDEAEDEDDAEDAETAIRGGSDDVIVDGDVADEDWGVVEVEESEVVEVDVEEEPAVELVHAEEEPAVEEKVEDDDDDFDAVEEGIVVDIESGREETEFDAVEDAEPTVRSDFVGRLFSRFGVGGGEETSAVDVVVDEEMEEEEEALPELAGKVDEGESLQPVEPIADVEEPKVEAVIAVEERVEAPIAKEKSDESKHEESRRRLLEAQQQQQAPAPRQEPQQHNSGPEIVYVGGYWKRANPWHKGPRIKAVD